MDNNKIKTKYLLATYLVVTALAIICLFVSRSYVAEGTWVESMLQNLSAELFGVVLIFFLVNRFFLVEEWETSERIEKLLEKLETFESTSAEQFFRAIPNLDTYIQSATQIDWCGVTMEEEVHSNISKLRDRLKAGANIRILIADPKSQALEMSTLRSDGIKIDRYQKKLDSVLDDMKYLHRSWTDYKRTEAAKNVGDFSVRLLPYAPSFGIFSFNKGQSDSVVFSEIYAHADGFGSFPTFSLTPQRDGEWYSFFTSQFEQMWETATQWEPIE